MIRCAYEFFRHTMLLRFIRAIVALEFFDHCLCALEFFFDLVQGMPHLALFNMREHASIL